MVAVRRGPWPVMPAVVRAVRMLLDPGAYPYYTAGLVLATVLLDLGWRRTRWPWVSMAVVGRLYVVRYLGPSTPTNAQLGWLRAATLLGVLAVALGPELRLRLPFDNGSGDRDGAQFRAARPGHQDLENIMTSHRTNAPTFSDPSLAAASVLRRGPQSAARSCGRRLRQRAVPRPYSTTATLAPFAISCPVAA